MLPAAASRTARCAQIHDCMVHPKNPGNVFADERADDGQGLSAAFHEFCSCERSRHEVLSIVHVSLGTPAQKLASFLGSRHGSDVRSCACRWYYTFLIAGGTIDERHSFAAQVLVYIVENIFLKDDDWKVAALWQIPQRHRT